jgi:hypothetical protein
MLIKVLGIDLGKTSFHLIGHNHAGREVYRKKCNSAQLLKTNKNDDVDFNIWI